ncbi:MAG: HIRAN domain-containing protein [Xenococcus sp. (in: cyanobacteria)]
MREQFPIFEISLEAPEEVEAMGTKEKFWFHHEELGLCLYKKARQNTGEDWSEKIAAELCQLIKLPQAEYELATFNKENGVYHIHFFVHGLRYMPKCSIERAKHLQPEERLYLTCDVQNPYDSTALLLRTEDHHNLGYCPRYLATDIFEALQQNPQSVCVRVERVNPAPTPIQFRLLCNMTAQWNHDFLPFSSQDYQPINVA